MLTIETNIQTGDKLSASDQRYVLSAYVHRFTADHKPQWARKPMPNGNAYPVQFADDADWLANSLFAVNAGGSLDMRVNGCQSSPTWPNNPELRKPALVSV